MRSAGKMPAASAGGHHAAQQTGASPIDAGPATGPFPLTLMLDHRTDNGGTSSSWVAPAAPGRTRSTSATAGRRARGDRADAASAWPRGSYQTAAPLKETGRHHHRLPPLMENIRRAIPLGCFPAGTSSRWGTFSGAWCRLARRASVRPRPPCNARSRWWRWSASGATAPGRRARCARRRG
ncbi:hypothetical protein Esi_0425_0021 [Ectocarpus siliculosus]|uniref:Uncharacterized protein n=1 Tax=Ectocarpus siliculosus TaxID=2880 RepID=D7G121_ECTSI|nr:hypothetical protein Esi_0425_0021 [Ectocarpus siliculosus]|eukprot:CBJ33131.1 hypothetical protein Esi_0425_0021 [Ectocarpus siliculosus]